VSYESFKELLNSKKNTEKTGNILKIIYISSGLKILLGGILYESFRVC
jgi:hypothetical protein